jgi:hypothetical protein
MKKKDWIYVFGWVLFLAIFILIYNYIRNKDIKDNYSVTCGIITKYYRTTKGITKIVYHYHNKDNLYKNVGGNGYFKDCDKTGWCIGKCYEVEYSSKNPNNSRMNFDKPCDCDSLTNLIIE